MDSRRRGSLSPDDRGGAGNYNRYNNKRSSRRSRSRERETARRRSSRSRSRGRGDRNRSEREISNDRDNYRNNYRGDFSSPSGDRRDRSERRDDREKSYRRNYSPQNSYSHNNSHNNEDDDWDSQESDNGDRYTSHIPHNKIVVRGLAQHITEADISSDLIQYGLKPLAIRLIRKKKTGASRGFAFVEFSSEEEATRWMEYKQGVLMLQDQYRALMQYSVSQEVSDARMSRSSASRMRPGSTDWYCAKCLVFNFRRRENCFKCFASREESERGGEGSDEISNVLTKKIIIRNLDVLTNEEGVLTVMQELIPDFVSKISKILICRDPLTSTSRGFCYLSFDNLVDSMNAHNGLKSLEPGLLIEGREVTVSYCVDDVTNLQSKSNRSQNISNNQSMSDSYSLNSNLKDSGAYQYTVADVPRLADYSANVYASNAAERDHYLKYYTQYYMGQISQGQYGNLPQLQETVAHSGAAVAQTAIQRKQKHAHQMPAPVVQTPRGNDGKRYPVPDVSLYQYDETSGFYYDSKTGLYYDSQSQYYYNNETNSYLYWDSENCTYLPAPSTAAAGANSVNQAAVSSEQNGVSETNSGGEEEKRKGEKAPDKVKVAKKIVKDMEKWAKQLNQKKEMGALQLPVPVKEEHPIRQTTATTSSVAADVGFSILEKKKEELKSPVASNKLVAAYGSDSDNDHDEHGKAPVNEKDYVDFEKLTCLLCQRAFQSLEILSKHLKMSNLHKENLVKYNLAHGSTLANTSQYRDRAKERRLKYGEADPPPVNRSKERFQKEIEKQTSSTVGNSSINLAAPLGERNMGNKLLQKMGWKDGQGLGRSNQGRINIIEVESRPSTAGLGNKTATAFEPGDDYKSYIKRMMKTRYEQVDST